MNGYTSDTDTIVDEPTVVEDKVVVGWDPDAGDDGAWVVTRTRVTLAVHRTTTRMVAADTSASYAEAARKAKADHELPVYLRADDRERAEAELTEAADEAAVVAAAKAQDIQAEAARRRSAKG